MRLSQRHVDKGTVKLRHANQEHGVYVVNLAPWCLSEGTGGPVWRQQRELVTHTNTKLVCKALTNGNTLSAVEVIERSSANILSDGIQALHVNFTYTTHQRARGSKSGRCQNLSIDHRNGLLHTLDLLKPLGQLVIIGKGLVHRLHKHVATDTKNFRDQFLAKAIHHRHHDDECRDAKQDPGK